MNKNRQNTNLDYDYIFKFVITGDSSVGKSSLLLRYSDNQFQESNWLPTIGVDFKQRSLKCKDKNVKISMWDTAGQERFKTIIRTYYKGCHGIILTFDVTNRDSFLNIEKWVQEVNEHGSTIYDKMFMLLIGNKCDLEDERMVIREEGEEMAKKLGCQYLETSAKNGQNVDKTFQELTSQLIEHCEIRKEIKQNAKNEKPKINLLKNKLISQNNNNSNTCC